MTGFFVYRSSQTGSGWKLEADVRTRNSLLALSNSWLLSENYSAHLTTIGHVALKHDYIVFVHHDRSFAGQLIPKPRYSAAGFDPFEIVTALPQATEALRDAVAWGDALHKSLTIEKAVGTLSFLDLNAALQAAAKGADDGAVDGDHTTESIPPLPWQAPANTLTVAIARALFLAEPSLRRSEDYFSVFPPGLKNTAAPLCRLVDKGGARPPAAILDAAFALPEARTEERPVALALSAPSILSSTSEKARAPTLRTAPISVRQLTPPYTGALDTRYPKTPKQEPTDRPLPTPSPATDDEPLPPPAIPPNGHARTGTRLVPWWLSPAATAAVALLLVVWVSSQMADLVQTEMVREQAEAERVQAETEREQAEAERVQAEAAREQAEAERVQAEAAREQAEAAREQAEAARVQAEAAREQAEAERVQAETEREDNVTLSPPFGSFGLPSNLPLSFGNLLNDTPEVGNE